MARMTAARAAVEILKREGVRDAFGVPGAAINPFYAALKASGGIQHTLARHVEGASHMAEGYTRTHPGNIGVCIGTSGPAGTDMITGLYSAIGDSIPILCVTGQAPTAVIHKEDFQAVDIASIARPVTKMAVTVLEAAQVPGVFQQAFHLMRSGRPGPVLIDLPDRRPAHRDRVRPGDVPAAPGLQAGRLPRPDREGDRAAERVGAPADRRRRRDHQRRCRRTPRRVRRVDRVPVVPTLMGWGVLPDDHELNAGMVGLQTSHRYGNATFLESDFVLGIGNRWANRHTGKLDVYTAGRVRPRRHRAHPDRQDLRPGLRHRVRRQGRAGAVRHGGAGVQGGRPAAGPLRVGRLHAGAQGPAQRRTHFDDIPIKPQRVTRR